MMLARFVRRALGEKRAGTILTHSRLHPEVRVVVQDRSKYQPRPPSNGIVIEVGAGQAPHARADLVVEKYLMDDTERPGEEPANFDRPLVVADGEHLPFVDGTASYAIASHVLEHAFDPVRFADELTRVASAGFVQVPTREAELLFGWPFHQWLIDHDDGRLTFEPKGEQHPRHGNIMHRSFAESPAFRVWFEASREQWHHTLHWSGRLAVTTTASAVPRPGSEFDLAGTTDLLQLLSEQQAVRGPTDELRQLLCCPMCHGRLAWTNVATCCCCSAAYPVVGGVPLLLREATTG